MAKSKDETVLKELEQMIVAVCETLRIASILLLPYAPQLGTGMLERLNYSVSDKDLLSQVKFDFARELNLSRVREYGALIAKVEDEPEKVKPSSKDNAKPKAVKQDVTKPKAPRIKGK